MNPYQSPVRANDLVNPDPLPRARCETCVHWCLSYRGGTALGECMVRPGSVRTYTTPSKGCDVNQGRAWTPLPVQA